MVDLPAETSAFWILAWGRYSVFMSYCLKIMVRLRFFLPVTRRGFSHEKFVVYSQKKQFGRAKQDTCFCRRSAVKSKWEQYFPLMTASFLMQIWGKNQQCWHLIPKQKVPCLMAGPPATALDKSCLICSLAERHRTVYILHVFASVSSSNQLPRKRQYKFLGKTANMK